MSAPALGERPIGLVLSGGAALGSWQAGMLCELVRGHGLRFHSVLGTSAGSINGAAYFQGELEKLEAWWRDVPRRRIVRLRPRLRPPSLLSMDAVREVLSELLSEEVCRERRRCWFYAVSVDIRNGEMVQAEYSPEEGGPWDAPLIGNLMGSVAVPFIFPPVELAANGKARLLVDGHVDSFARLRPMVERGVRDLLFLNVAGKTSPPETPLRPRRMISAVVSEMLRAQVRNALEGLRGAAPGEELRAFEFLPTEPLNMSVFGFKPKECRWAFELGVRDAAFRMGAPDVSRIL